MIILALCVILVLVLVLPFTFHAVERNLEVFLFIMGIAAAVVGGVLNAKLAMDALVHPWAISAAVLGMGFIFKWTRAPIERGVRWLQIRLSPKVLVFLLILALGLSSSVITVIVASLVLVEIISILRLDRAAEVRIVVLACFALGLGAALTPIGEPLSTIAVFKLSGEPYHAGFWFLLKVLGWWAVPGIAAFAALSLFFHPRDVGAGGETLTEDEAEVRRDESVRDVFVRAIKVYLFVMALVFLGEGFKPLVDRYVLKLPALALYWINTVSAVLDNATLTAAEISPQMEIGQIRDVLLGLLLAGGMLIPGNIPNIIAASKLKIRSKEWAVFALPVGFAVMAIYFVALILVPGDKAPDVQASAGPVASGWCEVRLSASDDRGLALIRILSGETVLAEVDPTPGDPLNFSAMVPVRPPSGARVLTIEVSDSTGHRIKRDLRLSAPPEPAKP